MRGLPEHVGISGRALPLCYSSWLERSAMYTNPIPPKSPNYVYQECDAPTCFCGRCQRGYSLPIGRGIKSPCCDCVLWSAEGGERRAMPSPPLH